MVLVGVGLGVVSTRVGRCVLAGAEMRSLARGGGLGCSWGWVLGR